MSRKSNLKPHHAPRFKVDHRPEDPTVTTIDLPGFRQTRKYTCGYATALMVLRYFDNPRFGKEVFDALGTGSDGTRQNALVRELRSSSVRINIKYKMTFGCYAKEIMRGRPVVSYLHDCDHWVVLYGIGRSPKRIFVADPRPKYKCEEPFENYRKKLQGFGMICSQKSLKAPRRSRQGALLPERYMVTRSAKGCEKARKGSAKPRQSVDIEQLKLFG